MEHKMTVSRSMEACTVTCSCGWTEPVRAPYGDKMAKDGTPKPATARDKAKAMHGEHVAAARRMDKQASEHSPKAVHDRVYADNRYARQLMPEVRREVRNGEWQMAYDLANELAAMFTSMADYIEAAQIANAKGGAR